MQIARADINDDRYEQWMKISIRYIWHKLTDEEVEAIEERRDVFFLAVKKKHGLGRAQAEQILSDLKHRIAEAA